MANIAFSNNNITQIQNSQDFSFYRLPSGMPDPDAEFAPFNYSNPDSPSWAWVDQRPRIKRPAQNADNCWTIAFELSPLVGKKPPAEFKEAKEFQEHLLQFIDRNAQLTPAPYLIDALVGRLKKSGLNSLPKEKEFLNLLALQKSSNPGLDALISEAAMEETRKGVSEFYKQTNCTDLTKYIKERTDSEIIKANITLFDITGIDFKSICINIENRSTILENEHKSIYIWQPEDFEMFWKKTSISGQRHAVAAARLYVVLQNLSFHGATWKPSESIDNLIQCLNKHGPLFVGGRFGNSFYTKQAEANKEEIGDCLTLSWDAKSRRTQDPLFEHAIIVTGAKKSNQGKGGGVVYFVDLEQESDPTSNAKKAVYKISYENYTTNVSPIGPTPRSFLSGYQISQLPRGAYAFYCKPEEVCKKRVWDQLPAPLPAPKMVPTAVMVDVGAKNAFGVINYPWKQVAHFELANFDGNPTWVGAVPKGRDFRFVKIYPDGTMNYGRHISFLKETFSEESLALNRVEFLNQQVTL
jgi:hypothetical protein